MEEDTDFHYDGNNTSPHNSWRPKEKSVIICQDMNLEGPSTDSILPLGKKAWS